MYIGDGGGGDGGSGSGSGGSNYFGGTTAVQQYNSMIISKT